MAAMIVVLATAAGMAYLAARRVQEVWAVGQMRRRIEQVAGGTWAVVRIDGLLWE